MSKKSKDEFEPLLKSAGEEVRGNASLRRRLSPTSHDARAVQQKLTPNQGVGWLGILFAQNHRWLVPACLPLIGLVAAWQILPLHSPPVDLERNGSQRYTSDANEEELAQLAQDSLLKLQSLRAELSSRRSDDDRSLVSRTKAAMQLKLNSDFNHFEQALLALANMKSDQTAR